MVDIPAIQVFDEKPSPKAPVTAKVASSTSTSVPPGGLLLSSSKFGDGAIGFFGYFAASYALSMVLNLVYIPVMLLVGDSTTLLVMLAALSTLIFVATIIGIRLVYVKGYRAVSWGAIAAIIATVVIIISLFFVF